MPSGSSYLSMVALLPFHKPTTPSSLLIRFSMRATLGNEKGSVDTCAIERQVNVKASLGDKPTSESQAQVTPPFLMHERAVVSCVFTV